MHVEANAVQEEGLEAALRRLPLMLDARTYNTSHPDYDATRVRNHPGKVFNLDAPSSNSVYAQIKGMCREGTVADTDWDQILDEALADARTVPHADRVFERRSCIEICLADLGRTYGAHYVGGWVNLSDALFLYWLVRQSRPMVIVQTGVCNGLSSAFMVLALVKNGDGGRLRAIDLPQVFDGNDAAWTIPGKVYGTTIPAGKRSGWMVPDAYRNRFDVQVGDAKALLPGLVEGLPAIDMFFHDSDHSYNHMMFEFNEIKRRTRAGSLVVADDISWNSSLWDFADAEGVPSYNFKGAVGVAFL